MIPAMRRLIAVALLLALAGCGATKPGSPLGKAADKVIDEVMGAQPDTSAAGNRPPKS
jgi:predicted small lipoprotein YifL